MKRTRSSRRAVGFTMIEVMIVVLIFSILLTIAVPNLIRTRAQTRAKACSRVLKNIDGVKEQYALENRKSNGDTVTLGDLGPYLRGSTRCPATGTALRPEPIGTFPFCSDGNTVAYKHSVDGL